MISEIIHTKLGFNFMVMDNENNKLIINQSALWKQASKELQEFFKQYKYFYCGNYNIPLWYYDKECGMPDYDYSSLYITEESFFQKYLSYFTTALTPRNVLPIGHSFVYNCFYPELNQILGEKTHILHDDSSEPWCVRLEKPYLLSKDIFEVISKYIVAHLNIVSLFEVRAEKLEGIPCIVTFAEIRRICNAEQFSEWVDSYNNLIKHDDDYYNYETWSISVYEGFSETNIECFDLCVKWKGDDSELKKLPLFVDVYRTEFGFSERFEVKHQMRVSIDDDSIIHIRPDKREICKFYYEKVMTAIKEANFWKRTGNILYEGVWDDSEMEHCVQFLIDNNYEQDNKRFISIKHWKDFSEFLSPEESYRMQCHFLVGMELL